MDYRTFKPHTDLGDFVKCYWSVEAPKGVRLEKQRIVPDGCIEMIFHHGDLYKQYDETENFILQPKSFVFGQITKPLYIEPAGDTGIFAVRFYPEGFIPFATIPIISMENKAVPLKELFGSEGTSLEQEVIAAPTTAQRISHVEKFLLANLVTPASIDRVVKSSIEEILKLKGQISIVHLSERLNVNRRQLERKFSTLIGLSPKQLSKVIRLQASLKLLSSNEFKDLTAIAYEGDYYDQAHFCNDFKEFTGVSPKHFYANSLSMSALFIGSD